MAAKECMGLSNGGVEMCVHQYGPDKDAPVATQDLATMKESGAAAPTAPEATVTSGKKAMKRGITLGIGGYFSIPG